MPLPNIEQPSSDQVIRALDAWEAAALARARGENPPVPSPGFTEQPSTSDLRLCYGLAVRLALRGIRRAGQAGGWLGWQLFSARHRILTDKVRVEPVTCGLNSAFTDLGLVLLGMGDVTGAVECLRRSARVYPCPHNTSFGLDPRLWRALEGITEAAAVRVEYERVARRFSAAFGTPRRRISRTEAVRILAKALFSARP